ncbi:hypothetical protein [Acinetobacter baumannii]|uniref:hypothetical protein n=1 Tax=Acinetobacter baumannii TaxID=470 RepID=UPI00244A99C5|nr:hypothetical protein [Acinetobacter baumannii]MDH2654128.1 hypothetical protein [Acinetobacter baumannii]
MTDLNKGSEVNLRFEQDDGAVWVFDGDSHQGTEISPLMMMHSDEYNEDELRVICNHAACEIDRLRAELEKAKAQAVPETHLLIPKEPNRKTIMAMACVCLGSVGSGPEFLTLKEAKDVYSALVEKESGAEG